MEFNEEERLYYRFAINNPRICYVSKGGANLGFVQEMSYGGFNLKLATAPLKSLSPAEKKAKENPYDQVELHFFGKMVRCLVEERHSTPITGGYQLIHEHTQVLLFLKEIIPFIRYGAALAFLEKAALEEKEPILPKGLAFEGPVPAEIKVDGYDASSIPNITMTLQHDKVIYQFTRLDNQILTHHNVWPGGESGRLRVTNGVDSNILRSAIAVLVGYAGGKADSANGKLIETILNMYESLISFSKNAPKKKAG